MTFLSKLGAIALQAGKLIVGWAPQIQAAEQKAAGIIDVFERVSDAVKQMEIIGQALQLPGPEKLKGVVPAVSQVLLDYLHAKGLKTIDDVKAQQASTALASAVADWWNAVHPDGVIEKTLG